MDCYQCGSLWVGITFWDEQLSWPFQPGQCSSGTMDMETEMEMEIPVCEITYDETNVCLQTAIMLRLVYNRSIFIRSGFFRWYRSKERMHCYHSHVISSLNEYVGSAGHALKVNISMPILRLISRVTYCALSSYRLAQARPGVLINCEDWWWLALIRRTDSPHRVNHLMLQS